jgi:anti-sigma factor RsiW
MLGGLAVAGVILVSQLAAPGSADGQLGAAFVDDYMRLAVREDHIVTSDSAEVRRFLMRELGTMVAPLSAPGFIIEGAEVCLLRGRRGAMIRYRTDAGPVSYYMVPGASVRGRLPTINTTSSNGTTLVTWVSGHTERALVGPLPAADLLAIARHETE